MAEYNFEGAEKYIKHGIRMAAAAGGVPFTSIKGIYKDPTLRIKGELVGFSINFNAVKMNRDTALEVTDLLENYLAEEENESGSKIRFYEKLDGDRDNSRRAMRIEGRDEGRRTEIWLTPRQQRKIRRKPLPQTVFGYFDGGSNIGGMIEIDKKTWQRRAAVSTNFSQLAGYRPVIDYDAEVRVFEPEGYDLINRAYTASILLGTHELPSKGARYAKTIEALLMEQQEKAAWTDLGGLDTMRDELFARVVGPSLNPELYADLKLKPSNILLVGPPGTGKTTICNILINEIKDFVRVPFKPSHMPGFCCEKMTPDLFFGWLDEISRDTGKHVLLLYDDIEDMGSRFEGDFSKTVHAWLRALDGSDVHYFSLVGTTNKPNELDPAFFRPGRIDRIYYIGPPGEKARREIIDIYARALPNYREINVDKLAKITDAYTGAEIKDVFDSCHITAISSLNKNTSISKIKAKDVVLTQQLLEKNIEQNKERIRSKTEAWGRTFTEEFKGKNKDAQIINMYA